MAYEFRPGEPLSREIRRVGASQLGQALDHLSDAANIHKGVHEARKCIKRTRSLLLLAAPAIGKSRFRSENRRLRDIARALAGVRDSQAMIETTDKLRDHYGQSWNKALCDEVRADLYARRKKAARALDSGMLAGARARLDEARIRIASLGLGGGLTVHELGLEHGYRQARHGYRRAFRRNRDKAFHEWRKSAQQHWRHMQLFRAAWPQELMARVETASELSRLLGDDHDLHVLIGLVRREGTGGRGRPMDFIGDCQRRQQELREQARLHAERLFAERPAAFVDRMAHYWNSARRAPARRPAQPGRAAGGKVIPFEMLFGA